MDQAISSLTNFLPAIVLARSVPTEEFGRYALLASSYWVTLGLARSLVSEPLLLTSTPDGNEPQTIEAGNSILSSAIFATAPTAMMGTIALSIEGGLAVLVLSLFLPILLVQDSVRYVGFTQRRYGLVVASDITWLLVFSAAWLGMAIGLVPTTLSVVIGCWGLGAMAGLWPLLRLQLQSWSLRDAGRWWWTQRRRGLSLAGEFALGSGTTQLAILLLPVASSLTVTGVFKAAQVAVQPWNVALTALGVLAMSQLAAEFQRAGQHSTTRCAKRLGTLVFIAGLGYASLLLIVPDRIGNALLGSLWTPASLPAILLAINAAFVGLGQVAVYLARVRSAFKQLLIGRLLLFPPLIAFPLVGASLGGAVGAASGYLIASGVGTITWWLIASMPLRNAGK